MLPFNCVCFYFYFAFTASHIPPKPNIDVSTFEEGKRQFEVIKLQSELPKYGQCWKNAMLFMQSGCKQLSDDMQGRLSLAYLNCFLNLQGRQGYICTEDISLEICTREMSDVDRGSYTTFFTHTQNICYFLQVQIWNEATESTISRLAENSLHVADQLSKSFQLQTEMMKHQNETLSNQKILLQNAANLSSVLTNSSEEINRFLYSFKETTREQRVLIGDVFEQLTSLRQMILGEFSGFYSILYYFLTLLVCYLLTSATRTSGARFWLFGTVTASVFCEYLVMIWVPNFLMWLSVELANHDEWVYWVRRLCRQLFAFLAFLLLGLFAYNYQDINAANNQLLIEIRKQNSDLKHLLHGIQPLQMEPEKHNNILSVAEPSDNEGESTLSSGSETGLDDNKNSDYSDRTYILPSSTVDNDSQSDSYMSVQTANGSALNRKQPLLDELRDLRSATPLKQMSGEMEQWITSGAYSHQEAAGSGSTTHIKDISRGNSPYLLRPRKSVSAFQPLAVLGESPRSFAKTVKQLKRISENNSRIVRSTFAAKHLK